MLRIKNISSGYGTKDVLYNVSLEVKEGEIVILTGGNGSGKSTLLRCIYNLLPIWNGAIFFNDQKIDGLLTSLMIRKGIVYIPQKSFYFENLTVDENLHIAGNIYTKKELKKRLNKVYTQTGLTSKEKSNTLDLSGGEKKLLAFGMCIVHKPRLILFDEPFAGVDPRNIQRILNVFNNYFHNNRISAIIVEHNVANKLLYTRKIKIELGCIKN